MAQSNQTQLDNPRLSGPMIVDKITKGSIGQKLALIELDILVGIEGQAYTELGPLEDEIDYQLEEFRRPVLLSFMREGRVFNVLTERPLGVKFVPAHGESLQSLNALIRNVALPFSQDMQNYHIFCDKDKNAELRSQTTSILAMVAPPLWILSQRFFEGAVVAVLAILTAFVVHWGLGMATYVLMCIYVGRDQKELGQSFMGFRGFRQIYCLASRSEIEAQQSAKDLDEDLQFIFAAWQAKTRLPKPVPSRAIGE